MKKSNLRNKKTKYFFQNFDSLLEFLDLKKMLTIDFMTAITMYFYLNSCISESELESHPIKKSRLNL